MISKASASKHRTTIRKVLDKSPGLTAREIERKLRYKLEYHQIMRRLHECAKPGIKRECSTGLPSKDVTEWY